MCVCVCVVFVCAWVSIGLPWMRQLVAGFRAESRVRSQVSSCEFLVDEVAVR